MRQHVLQPGCHGAQCGPLVGVLEPAGTDEGNDLGGEWGGMGDELGGGGEGLRGGIGASPAEWQGGWEKGGQEGWVGGDGAGEQTRGEQEGKGGGGEEGRAGVPTNLLN